MIISASKAIKDLPEIKAPSIRSTKVSISMTDEGVETMYAGDKVESYGGYSWKIPDVLGYIQSKTELTRSTIQKILSKSGRIGDILTNPQLFLDSSAQTIKRTLYDIMIDGIKYQQIGGSEQLKIKGLPRHNVKGISQPFILLSPKNNCSCTSC